jgi:DNA invertase Pin-like site-specific DNA recombinase
MNYEFLKYHLENLKPGEVLAYLRKSRSDDFALSVEEVLQKHEAILDDWARENLGEVVPEENKYREVVSGETLTERPEINRLLKKIESPRYRAVCVVEPQRLTRGDLEDIGRITKLFKHTNTLVITPQHIYDLHDEYDRDMLERELKRGNDYLEYTKKILNRGRLLSVSQGNYIGSVAPYGYRKAFVQEGKRKCPTLIEHPEEADIIRMIFDLYVHKDMGRQTICNYLDDLGIKPPKGNYWSPAALKDMLENVHYIGKVKWNFRKTVTVVDNGDIIKTRPKAKTDDCLIYDGKHAPIVSEALFYAAQEKQGRNHRTKASTKVRNPFAGLLFCSCGKAMVFRTYKDKDGREKSQPRLLCNNQTHCHTGSCLYNEVLERVCASLRQSIHDFEVILSNEDKASQKLHQKLIQSLGKKLDDLQAKELSMWEAQATPDLESRMPQEIFKQLNAKLQKEKEDTRAALCKARKDAPQTAEYEEQLVRFQDALSAMENESVSAAEKNQLLKACIDRIEYFRETPSTRYTSTPFQLKISLKL